MRGKFLGMVLSPLFDRLLVIFASGCSVDRSVFAKVENSFLPMFGPHSFVFGLHLVLVGGLPPTPVVQNAGFAFVADGWIEVGRGLVLVTSSAVHSLSINTIRLNINPY